MHYNYQIKVITIMAFCGRISPFTVIMKRSWGDVGVGDVLPKTGSLRLFVSGYDYVASQADKATYTGFIVPFRRVIMA